MAVQLDPVHIAFGLASPPALGWWSRRVPGVRGGFYAVWASCAIGGIIGAVLPPATWDAAWASGGSLVIAVILWWLSRRRRRRSPKLAGAKSRALLAAVVRTMRERSRPRPVLRPQPQGAS